MQTSLALSSMNDGRHSLIWQPLLTAPLSGGICTLTQHPLSTHRSVVLSGGDCIMVKSGLAGHPEVASGDISLTDVQCTAPGHSGLSLGPELAGASFPRRQVVVS